MPLPFPGVLVRPSMAVDLDAMHDLTVLLDDVGTTVSEVALVYHMSRAHQISQPGQLQRARLKEQDHDDGQRSDADKQRIDKALGLAQERL